MMTGFSEMRRWILISVDSVTSMASGEVVVGVSSRRTPPSVNVRKRRTPCIAGEKRRRKRKRKRKRKRSRGKWGELGLRERWTGVRGFIYKKRRKNGLPV